MIEYGDELMTQTKITDEHTQTTIKIDNDHVLNDTTYQAHENGDY